MGPGDLTDLDDGAGGSGDGADELSDEVLVGHCVTCPEGMK
ncbi:MAG: hypothetical protein ABIJ00_15970 [Candidatus Eisenbacteria bacterium]